MTSIAEPARKALEQVLASNPLVLVILYETEKVTGHVAVPPAQAVASGLITIEANRISD